ncbi:LuxR family transcriptional regulator [Mesorhizobium atlanticum]|uniref:LuxR family transcriptional regulator n=1 Tax=Mesorhizobium atlanticum TaxID=2233532 RepID=A0A330GRC8_9HYPH|nr:LuxR family transcriptional regulator [Mesorhizobium atlanticum]RAZ71850.1 LuxR family transcriptional regulator [Mesorhizobium atlanticum]
MKGFALELGRFLDQADGIGQSDGLFDQLSTFALKFDCPWVAYSSLALRGDQKFTPRDRQVILNFPSEWQKRYVEMGHDRIDPILKVSRKRADAFRWSEIYNDASTTDDERRVFDEAAAFGLKSGMSVPLHEPNGTFAVTSFARSKRLEFESRTVTFLELAAFHFHRRISSIMNPRYIVEPPGLSQREKECILWAARGKSSWEIGKILGISANTVNFHIKNVARKLDAASRTVAAIKALEFGIIKL